MIERLKFLFIAYFLAYLTLSGLFYKVSNVNAVITLFLILLVFFYFLSKLSFKFIDSDNKYEYMNKPIFFLFLVTLLLSLFTLFIRLSDTPSEYFSKLHLFSMIILVIAFISVCLFQFKLSYYKLKDGADISSQKNSFISLILYYALIIVIALLIRLFFEVLSSAVWG